MYTEDCYGNYNGYVDCAEKCFQCGRRDDCQFATAAKKNKGVSELED